MSLVSCGIGDPQEVNILIRNFAGKKVGKYEVREDVDKCGPLTHGGGFGLFDTESSCVHTQWPFSAQILSHTQNIHRCCVLPLSLMDCILCSLVFLNFCTTVIFKSSSFHLKKYL